MHQHSTLGTHSSTSTTHHVYNSITLACLLKTVKYTYIRYILDIGYKHILDIKRCLVSYNRGRNLSNLRKTIVSMQTSTFVLDLLNKDVGDDKVF